MYKIGRVLGRGAYGKVNIAAHKLSKKLCAVKSINMNKINQNLSPSQVKEVLKRVIAEREILARLKSEHVVKLYEAIKHENGEDEYQLMFMEICAGGSMLQYLRRRRRLEERVAKLFMKQLIRGLGYIHHEGVVHRDIKLENILLSNLGMIKICDFGVSVVLDPEKSKDQIDDCCGTPAYMAPEVIAVGEVKKMVSEAMKQGKKRNEINSIKKDLKPYGPECDIWSAGVVLYALIYGQLPFRGLTIREIKEKILRGFYNLKEQASESVRDLIKRMLEPDRKARITIEDILNHPWLQDAPNQDDVTVFDESERATIIKEFFISEDWDKWEKFIRINSAVYDEYFRFTVVNLYTDYYDMDDADPNMSDRSEILAPNNSDQEPKIGEDGNEIPFSNSGAYDKDDKIEFCKMAEIADDEYEREHDDNCDNGVYREDADIEVLAKKSGLKQHDVPWYEFMQQLKDEQRQEEAKKRLEQMPKHALSKLKQMGTKPPDLDFIDENVNWFVGELEDQKNPYGDKVIIRGDLVFQVNRFGYTVKDILKSVINGKTNH